MTKKKSGNGQTPETETTMIHSSGVSISGADYDQLSDYHKLPGEWIPIDQAPIHRLISGYADAVSTGETFEIFDALEKNPPDESGL